VVWSGTVEDNVVGKVEDTVVGSETAAGIFEDKVVGSGTVEDKVVGSENKMV